MTALVHHRRDTAVTPVVERRVTTGSPPSGAPNDQRTDIRAGIRSMLPWLVGVIGMNARTSGLQATAVDRSENVRQIPTVRAA